MWNRLPSTPSLLVCAALLVAPASAQYAERPALAGSGDAAVDVSGRSIKSKRVRGVHTRDPSLRGGTAYLFEQDPFLAYQLGRNLNFREFRPRDGVFSDKISNLGATNPDGVTAKITANNQVSCAGCHNLPQGTPGGGVSFSKDSGRARNSPHYFGAGLVEMLALQNRGELLAQLDTNGDGWVSKAEADAGPNPIQIATTPGGAMVSYGDPRLDAAGRPHFNNIVKVWYVDAAGKHVLGADHVDGVLTHGYNLELIVWGWGQGAGRAALNPTNRAFLWDPFNAHSGLQADDLTTNFDADGDGVSEPSLAGALQFPATHRTPDLGLVRDALGFSRDDPDGDGILCEITEGDLDLGEWFMLNAPRPAFRGTAAQYAQGQAALQSLACDRCHVADWQVQSRGPRHPGDRRLVDLDVTWNENRGRLEGQLVRLYDESGGRYQLRYGGYLVQGLFSDLRHHDMGAGFAETDFGGTINQTWRTPPLWGVGSGFPWGHDGQSLSLEDVILRHDGEGAASRDLFRNADAALKATVLDFLARLVLYDIESLPADIDGDGSISTSFMVAGMDTGVERFNAEWLFRVPVKIQGPFVNHDGVTIRSFAAQNLAQAYGYDLAFRIDSDDDGWPDCWDVQPHRTGYGDGRQ